jgi:hypothetical protein
MTDTEALKARVEMPALPERIESRFQRFGLF